MNPKHKMLQSQPVMVTIPKRRHPDETMEEMKRRMPPGTPEQRMKRKAMNVYMDYEMADGMMD